MGTWGPKKKATDLESTRTKGRVGWEGGKKPEIVPTRTKDKRRGAYGKWKYSALEGEEGEGI